MTDSEIVAAILAGDTRAFERLISRHEPMLFRTARAILRNDADAEDAVQDALLQAYQALGSFRGESKVSTWLVRITINAALMRRRAAKPPPQGMAAADTASAAPGPDRHAAGVQMRKRLQAAFDQLPEDYKAVIRLRSFEELGVEETAAALGIPEATVRSRHWRARALLRQCMAPELDQPSSVGVPLVILERDRERLRRLRPHAALLREIDRATVIAMRDTAPTDAVIMNSQVRYVDETTGKQRQVNIVYPHQAGGCACCVSILAPTGTALIGLSAGQSIEWDFPDGRHHLLVKQVIQRDCPLNTARAA
jgi:RNA polymerase sigma-70 factor, ECF subfamily